MRFAIDVFGIAHPSLAALSSLSIDTLKIDRSFTIHITPNTSYDKAVTTLINSQEAQSRLVIEQLARSVYHIRDACKLV